jgi:hypothetical protein
MGISDLLEAIKREQSPEEAIPAPPPAASPAPQPSGPSNPPAVDVLEPDPSAAACVFCPAPLAEDDPIACTEHRERLRVTAVPPLGGANRNAPPAMSSADLLAIAELRGWEALPIRRGESAGGSEDGWRVFAGWIRGSTLRRASEAAWTLWRSTVEQYAQRGATAVPESLEAA